MYPPNKVKYVGPKPLEKNNKNNTTFITGYGVHIIKFKSFQNLHNSGEKYVAAFTPILTQLCASLHLAKRLFSQLDKLYLKPGPKSEIEVSNKFLM